MSLIASYDRIQSQVDEMGEIGIRNLGEWDLYVYTTGSK